MVQKAQPYKYQVYNEIKRGILKGQYVPGDVLTERRLSEEMGISRTPIREAMQMLEHDGWLGVETYKGALVREFDLEYVKEHAASEACMAVFTGLTEGQEIHLEKTGQVKALEEIGWY